MQLNNVIVEITRQCNIQCDHCLRGDSENKDIAEAILDNLFSQITSISSLTISGGEPFLKPKLIHHLLQLIAMGGIDVGIIYIATNGTVFSSNLPNLIIRASELVNESFQIAISNDEFHEEAIDRMGLSIDKKFDLYKCVTNKYDKRDYVWHDRHLINEGNAKLNHIGRRELINYPIETKNDFESANIYLNVNGDIINGCDYSYENQDYHILCTVDNLTEYYNSLKDE